jgi:hypothetical protein
LALLLDLNVNLKGGLMPCHAIFGHKERDMQEKATLQNL